MLRGQGHEERRRPLHGAWLGIHRRQRKHHRPMVIAVTPSVRLTHRQLADRRTLIGCWRNSMRRLKLHGILETYTDRAVEDP